MNRNEVVELFKILKDVYPTFEVSTQKVNTWARLTEKMDFKRVMKKTEEHVATNKFPPTISEIAAYAPEENKTLKQVEEWKREAAKVPESTKLEFRKKMKELIKEKSNAQ